MPLYEFHCRRCKQDFSAFMHMAEHDASVATCPRCGRTDAVQARISIVNVMTSRKS